MKILVSACLLGENCKYNGGNNYSAKLAEFLQGHEVIPVCPEVLGGLPIPRKPCEIVNGVVLRADGVSCDHEYHLGAEKALQIAEKEDIDLAVLQSRSPSCGVLQVYDGSFSKKLKDGQGIFAEMLIREGFRAVDIETLE